MATLDNAAGIAILGREIKERSLVQGLSFLTDDLVWIQENFTELDRAYVERPDESSRTFDEKVVDQLDGVSSGARQLFGELYLLEVLVLRDMLPSTKIERVDAILEHCDPPLSLAEPGTSSRMRDVKRIVDGGGVLRGGQGYFANRWRHLVWLIRFGVQWTALPPAERARLMASADGIEEALFTLPDTQDRTMQLGLAFILAPRHFAAIVSQNHLEKILRHFGPKYPDVTSSTNPARIVGEIQQVIRKERGADWEFYLDRDEWNPRKDKTAPVDRALPAVADAPAEAPTEDDDGQHVLPPFTRDAAASLLVDQGWLDTFHALLAHRRQVVLEGPPGTGKTYLARRMARMLAGSRDRVRLVQFHPAYTYEDFFEGFRPTETGALVLRDGPLKTLATAAAADDTGAPYFLIIDEMNRGNLARIFGELYFLLEYRDESVQMMYSQEEFTLPSNLYIIATMNSADRSIAVVDAAMRRRFAFVSLEPSREPTRSLLTRWAQRENVSADVPALWQRLNATIAARDSSAVLGPSYFMRAGIDAPGVLDRIWEFEILPQVREAFFGADEWIDRDLSLAALCGQVPGAPTPHEDSADAAQEAIDDDEAGNAPHTNVPNTDAPA